MSKPGELHRIDMPKRQAPQGASQKGMGAAPKAATTPLRNQREQPPERPVRSRRKSARDTAPRARDTRNDSGSSFEHAQTLMRAVAVGIPILGLIGGSAFLFGLTTLGNPETSFPMAFVVSLAALFGMLGGITIVALVLLRQSRDLAIQTETMLNRYLEPESAAAQSIATLGNAIKHQIDEMAGGVDGIVRRVSAIEKQLQGQTGELLRTMDLVEQRAQDASKSLAAERDKIDDAARTLSAEVQITSQSFDEQVAAAREAMNKASGALRAVENKLAERIADFSEAAERGAAEARDAGDQLEQQAGRVAEISEGALAAAQTVTRHYTEQHGMMDAAVALLNKESERIEQVFGKQRTMLRELAETAARQSRAIEDSISSCMGGLDVTLQLAQQRAEAIAGAFGEQADSILQAGEDAAGSMMQAAETAQATASGARDAIEANAAAAAQALERQLVKLREALTGLSDETAEALERQAESSQAALDQQMSGLRKLMDARMRQARALFDSMTADFARTLDDQLKALSVSRDDGQNDWEAWRDRIGTALEGVRLQARDCLQMLNQTAGEVEGRLAGLPDRLSEGAAKVRTAMSEQVGALDGIAEQARRAVGDLETMMRALPDNVDTGTKRIAERLQGQARAIEGLAATAEDRVKAVEQIIDRLPARLDSQTDRIRGTIDAQIQMIESLAGTAERRAKDIAALHGRAEPGTVPPAPPARQDSSNLSVQEILAKREADGVVTDDLTASTPPPAAAPPQAAPGDEKTEDGIRTTPQLPPRRAGGDAPRSPQQAVRGRPDARSDTPNESRTDYRRPAWGRQTDESPGTEQTEGKDAAPAPAWLRRSSGGADGDGTSAAPTDDGKDTQTPPAPQKAPPIFRKRFTDFEEPGSDPSQRGETPDTGKPRPADDPVRMIRGNAARPAAAKPETNRFKSDQRPERPGRPQAERPQQARPQAKPPQLTPPQTERQQQAHPQAEPPQKAGPKTEQRPPARVQTGRPQTPGPQAGARKQPERPSPARRVAVRAETAKPTPPPPPRRTPQPPAPRAGKEAMPDRPPARRPDPRESMPGLPAEGSVSGSRSGNWGWSEILAAADRASHDGDAPARADPVPSDESAEENAATGGDVGTPELQEIGREIVETLKGLSVDLRPVWEEDLPLAVLRRFLAGDRRALTRQLPILGGMEMLTRTRRCYRSDGRFRSNVDRFAREFDMLVDQIHGLDAPRAERYMSSQNGRLFILLTQVLTKS